MSGSASVPAPALGNLIFSERLSRALSASASDSSLAAGSTGGATAATEAASGADSAASPAGATSIGLFAYGTLTLDPVISALLDRIPPSQVSRAPGWRAAGLPGLPYPGLVRDAACVVGAPGRLYLDLTPREWALLDDYENPEYEVGLVTLDGGQKALAYLWPDVAEADGGAGQALATTWTVSWAVDDKEGMAAYLERTVKWREAWEGEMGADGGDVGEKT